jgi:hypothetical protein
LIAVDAVYDTNGVQLGWWYGDHLRNRNGQVRAILFKLPPASPEHWNAWSSVRSILNNFVWKYPLHWKMLVRRRQNSSECQHRNNTKRFLQWLILEKF